MIHLASFSPTNSPVEDLNVSSRLYACGPAVGSNYGIGGRGLLRPKPPRPKSHGTQANPPSSGGTVHAQGVKSWGGSSFGGSFVWMQSQLDPMPPISSHGRRARRLPWPPLTSLSHHYDGKLIWACRAVHSRKVINRPDPTTKNIPIKVVPLGSSAQITKSIATAKTR